MTLNELISWLNANQGAATVIGTLAAALLTGLGWTIAQSIRASAKAVATPAPTVPSTQSDPSRLDDLLEQKSIKVGVLDYPPMMTFTVDPSGLVHAAGIYPRLIAKIAEEECLAVEWIVLNWSDVIDAVKQDRVHMVASIFWTPKRSEHATFCSGMHRIGVTGIVRADETLITTHEDLKRADLKVGVVRGEIGWEYATDVLNLAF